MYIYIIYIYIYIYNKYIYTHNILYIYMYSILWSWMVQPSIMGDFVGFDVIFHTGFMWILHEFMSLWGVLVWFDVEFMRSLCDFGVLWWFHEEFYWCLMWFYGWGMLGSWGFDVFLWLLCEDCQLGYRGICYEVQLISQLEIFGRVDCSGESEPVLWGCRSNL